MVGACAATSASGMLARRKGMRRRHPGQGISRVEEKLSACSR